MTSLAGHVKESARDSASETSSLEKSESALLPPWSIIMEA